VTILADDAATRSVLENPDGIFAGFPEGGIHEAASTLGLEFSKDLAERQAGRGQWYVAAPVFGRRFAVEQHALRVVAASPHQAMTRIRPLLDAERPEGLVIGDLPHRAHAMKQAGNFVMTSVIEAIYESLVLIDKVGVEPEQLAQVLGPVFRSPLIENHCRSLLEGRFDKPAFRFRLGL
jgi:3-hydroxyisobutyrate dehydrogenase-like beta-hydroxyacid dehydrogenase